jgi:hypothetical protein
MAIVDYWDNPLVVAPTQVIGYRGDIEEFPHDLYSFLLSTIREADREDVGLIWRWLQPMQQHWESQYASILSIMQLKSPELCPEEFLDYLRKDIGIMDDLAYLWGVMTTAEKRRFIKFFVRFLRFRSSSFGATEMISTMTGQPARIFGYFNFRWIISGDAASERETAIGREDDGYDPWLISESVLSVGAIPNYVEHATPGGIPVVYTFQIDNLLDTTEERPFPEWIFIKHLGTGVTVRARIVLLTLPFPPYSWNVAYTEPGETFLQPSSDLSDEPTDFRLSWEPDDLVYDIIMEDDGTLNRDMIVGLARFSRPMSERVYIRYYNFIELFDSDDVGENWTTDAGTATFTEGQVVLSDGAVDTKIRLTKTGADEYDDYALTVKMKQGVAEKYAQIRFMRQAVDDYYYLQIEPATVPNIPPGTWNLVRVVGGGTTVLASGTLEWLDLDVDYVWRIECVTSDRPGGQVQYIRIYQDENLLGEVADDPIPWGGNVEGTVEIVSEVAGSVTASRVLIHPLPMEFDYVGP